MSIEDLLDHMDAALTAGDLSAAHNVLAQLRTAAACRAGERSAA